MPRLVAPIGQPDDTLRQRPSDEKDMTIDEKRTPGPRIRVTFVISHVIPLTGIGAATVSLADDLTDDYDVHFVEISGKSTGGLQNGAVTLESWGGKVTGWRRIYTVLRAFKHRNDLDGNVIVLSGAWASIPLLITLPRRLRTKALVWEHSFGNEQIRSNRNLAILRAVARPLYARARATITVSESLRRDMLRAGFGGTIEVIPNIVRKFDTDHGMEVVPGKLLAIGSLTKNKNQSLALRTLALLPDHYSLDIVGDGPERSALERLAAELGLANRVQFRGFVPNPAQHFARAQCVIHCALGETYGLVLFEASDFRKPVVAANQSIMPELIPQLVPGVVAEPEPHAFASAILSLEAAPVADRDYAEAAHRRELVSQNIARDWRRLIDGSAL